MIDITRELFSAECYPDDPKPKLKWIKTLERDGYNLSEITMCVHNGTHIDAPKHFTSGGGVETIPLEKLIGRALVAPFDWGLEAVIDKAEKAKAKILLLRGGYLDEKWAETCVKRGFSLIGTDGVTAADIVAHKVLLSANVVLL